MAQFNIGDKVLLVNTNAHGVVIKVMPARRGRQLYTVNFSTGNQDVFEVDLKVDFDESDPFERCKNGIYGSYSEYSKRNTAFKIKNSNNSTISSLKASKTLFRAYQFKPLLKFLNSPNRRLLVADEVGLGKTIEAGHIMLELKARRELKNVLIVCPKSLQEKWKAELYEKFGLTFKIVDNAKDLIADLQAKTDTVRAIVNYEKVRMREKATKEEQRGGKHKYTNLIDYLSENPQRFSLVLCDEAHRMRNKNQTYKGSEIIMSCADAALFLTATPIMISEENLYNLLHLLDNTRYFNLQIFMNRLKENRPFVEAISLLNHNVALSSIMEGLQNANVQSIFSAANGNEIYSCRKHISELYADDPIFQEIKDLMEGEDTPKVRARLQYLLSTMSVMNTVFSRTRKREVTTDMSQAERKPHPCKVDLYPEEQKEFDAVIENYIDDNSYTTYDGEGGLTQGGALGLVQKKRQVASSVWGYLNKETDLDCGIDVFASYQDAKVEKLQEIIEEVFKSGTQKLVVFALFRRTLKYLYIRLKKMGYNALIIHGQVENRAEILTRFKKDKNIHILLSSEVGSEGLDIQFCNSMVNYDLPWNPMVVEQRIGRIDRFGQKAKVVNIYNLVVAGSIQEEIYMRLLERIGIFRSTIGDMEAILDANVGNKTTIQDVYNRMEKEFFTKELTHEEKEQKIAEVVRAIENEKENLQHLQEGLSNTLTNDAYFRDEINRILYNNAYVTDVELRNFITSAIRQCLTTCNMEEIENGVMEFTVPISQPSILKNFLTQYCDNNDESNISVNQFKRRIDDQHKFLLTFNQEKAYEDSSLNYLNIYHPMIQACLNYFIENDDDVSTSFSYALQADELLHEGDKYFMGLYQLTTSRMVQNVKKTTEELQPVLFNLQTYEVETDEAIVDRIYRRSQVDGNERNVNNDDVQPEAIEDMRYDFAEYICETKKRRIDETNRQIESDRKRNEQQTQEYYSSRIDNLKANIRKWETEPELNEKEQRNHQGAIRLAKANIAQLQHERDERLLLINENSQLSIEDKLLSLNLIIII